jgi:ATP-dependent Clp protease ATP-binding subunit ClpX
MLDLMYQVPGQKKMREVVITREMVVSKSAGLEVIEKAG